MFLLEWVSGNCGGCGFGNLGCPIARCSRDRGGYEYCTQCPKYPCEKYAHVDEYDSFITHRNQKSNLEKLQEIGEEKYILEQQEKRPFLSDKYDITQHPNYKYTSDFDKKYAFDIEKYLNRRMRLKADEEYDVIEIWGSRVLPLK